jgi:hypothetical protein
LIALTTDRVSGQYRVVFAVARPMFERSPRGSSGAWRMWLVPTGYCFPLQAGSIANDMFCAVFAGLRLFRLASTRDERIGDLWLDACRGALHGRED